MKRFLSVILILLFALQMPCLAEVEKIEVGASIVVEDIAVAEDGMDPTNVDAAPVVEEEAATTEEAASAAEDEVASEAKSTDTKTAPADEGTLSIDTEVIAAPIEADVPEAAAELGDEPQMAFELFEPDGEMTWASVRDELQAGNDVTLTNNVTRGDGDETIDISYFECTLDLNGYTLENGESGEPAIRVDGSGEDDTKFTITDSSADKTGTILYRGNNYGTAAIEVKDGATLTLAGGGIASAIPDDRQGYGVKCAESKSRFNMEGGSITGFETAVFLENNASLHLSGGTVSACGYGVECNIGVAFTMSGGTITGCKSGVKLFDDSAMTMTGGTITQNQNKGVSVDSDAALSVSGSPVIAGEGVWWSYGVSLDTGRAITVTGALGEDAQIGVSMVTPGLCVVGVESYTLSEDDLIHFSSDSPDYAIIMNAEGKGELVKKPVPDASPDPVPATPATPATPTTPAPTQLSVTKKNSTSTAFLGMTYQIVPGTGTGTRFKSSNKKVATVNQTGLVTLHRAGKAKITFKVGKKKRTVTLKVKDPTVPTSVVFTPVEKTVKKGDTITLTPVVPEGTVAGGFKWKSSNKKVARVDQNGKVTFRKRGKVTITATAKRGKKKAKIRFKVSK